MNAFDIKETIQDILIDFNLTQKAFADKIGVKQSQVSEWIKGKAKPGYDNLRNICLAFSLSGNYILGLE